MQTYNLLFKSHE